MKIVGTLQNNNIFKGLKCMQYIISSGELGGGGQAEMAGGVQGYSLKDYLAFRLT